MARSKAFSVNKINSDIDLNVLNTTLRTINKKKRYNF